MGSSIISTKKRCKKHEKDTESLKPYKMYALQIVHFFSVQSTRYSKRKYTRSHLRLLVPGPPGLLTFSDLCRRQPLAVHGADLQLEVPPVVGVDVHLNVDGLAHGVAPGIIKMEPSHQHVLLLKSSSIEHMLNINIYHFLYPFVTKQ